MQEISSEWVDLNRIIKVERIRLNQGHLHTNTAYYISSLEDDTAELFHDYIQQHWSIENRLHWVKDVSMREDKSKTVGGMAAENIFLLRKITINLYRADGFDSIRYATQRFANNLKELIKLIKMSSNKNRT